MQVGVDSQVSLTAASAQADRLAQAAQGLARDAKSGVAGANGGQNVPHEFSKLLATMLVKEMRQALPEGFFGEGAGSDIFDGWLDDHLGTALADRDGLRLEGLIAASMQSKLQSRGTEEAKP